MQTARTTKAKQTKCIHHSIHLIYSSNNKLILKIKQVQAMFNSQLCKTLSSVDQ